MGFFDLFRRKLKYEDLQKIGNEDQIKEKLLSMNLKDLQKVCLTKCQDLDTEIKQKDVYIGAILDSLRKSGLMEPQVLDKPMELSNSEPTAPIEDDKTNLFESKPVDLQAPPAPAKEEPFIAPGPAPEQRPPMGGKRKGKNSRNKKDGKQKGGKTKKRKAKKSG